MIKLNLNSILVVLGGLGVFAPDITAVATSLDGLNIRWVGSVVKVLGLLAVFFAAAPLAVPRLRKFLALWGLATPVGTVVPPPADSTLTDAALPTKAPRDKESGLSLWGFMAAFILVFVLLFLCPWIAIRMANAAETDLNPIALPVLPEIQPLPPIPPPTVKETKPTTEPVVQAVPKPSTTVAEEPKKIDPAYPEATPASGKTMQLFDSKYGKCYGRLCLAPAFALQVFRYTPSTGDMAGGVAFAGGYGLVWHAFVDLGLAGYTSVLFSRDRPFQAEAVLMFSVDNYFAFGPGFQMLGQTGGPAKFLLTVSFAANWIPGLTAEK